MSNNHLGAKELVMGVALGGLIATVGTLLLAPKKGTRMRRDVSEMLEDLSDMTQDKAGKLAKKGKCVANSLGDQACEWTDKLNCLLGRIKESECSTGSGVQDFAIGAIAGGVLGAAVGLLVAKKPGDEFRESMLDSYHELTDDYADQIRKSGKKFAKVAKSKSNHWIDVAKNFVEDLAEDSEELSEHVAERVKNYSDVGHDKISQILEWASLGIKVWNKLSK